MTIFIKAVFVGIAAVVPGLSASVFAVVAGIYDDLIFSVNNLKSDFKNQIKFLAPFAVGGVVGVLISTKIILDLCLKFPLFSYAFFIGLVLGSVPFVLKKIGKSDFLTVVLAVIGFIFIYIISFFSKTGSEDYVAIAQIRSFGDVATVFAAGAFSVSMMTIPGVSGSVLLMVINQYGTIYNAVSKISVSLLALVKGEPLDLAPVFIIIPFAVGAIIGFVLIAKLLFIILKKYSERLYSAVIGIIAAAAVTLFTDGIWANRASLAAGASVWLNVVIAVALVGLGYFLTTKFD
jgi:putative membrane protein